LKQAGADKVYAETISGAITDRKQLAKAVESLTCGDLLLVTRLDRLARSTRDLLNILAEVSANGAKFKSISDAWADTTTPHGELMITILAGLATFERHLIKARTGEAKARGVRFGRKPKLTLHQIQEALARRHAGEALAEIGRTYNVSHSTISRLSNLSTGYPTAAASILTSTIIGEVMAAPKFPMWLSLITCPRCPRAEGISFRHT
jgi:DNA invertase Pin-like site-specific DNA recombinase